MAPKNEANLQNDTEGRVADATPAYATKAARVAQTTNDGKARDEHDELEHHPILNSRTEPLVQRLARVLGRTAPSAHKSLMTQANTTKHKGRVLTAEEAAAAAHLAIYHLEEWVARGAELPQGGAAAAYSIVANRARESGTAIEDLQDRLVSRRRPSPISKLRLS